MQLTTIVLGAFAFASSAVTALPTATCGPIQQGQSFHLFSVGKGNALTNVDLSNSTINGQKALALVGNGQDTFLVAQNGLLIADGFKLDSNPPTSNQPITFFQSTGTHPPGNWGLASSNVAPNSCFVTFNTQVNNQFSLCQFLKQSGGSKSLFVTFNDMAPSCTPTKLLAVAIQN